MRHLYLKEMTRSYICVYQGGAQGSVNHYMGGASMSPPNSMYSQQGPVGAPGQSGPGGFTQGPMQSPMNPPNLVTCGNFSE